MSDSFFLLLDLACEFGLKSNFIFSASSKSTWNPTAMSCVTCAEPTGKTSSEYGNPSSKSAISVVEAPISIIIAPTSNSLFWSTAFWHTNGLAIISSTSKSAFSKDLIVDLIRIDWDVMKIVSASSFTPERPEGSWTGISLSTL